MSNDDEDDIYVRHRIGRNTFSDPILSKFNAMSLNSNKINNNFYQSYKAVINTNFYYDNNNEKPKIKSNSAPQIKHYEFVMKRFDSDYSGSDYSESGSNTPSLSLSSSVEERDNPYRLIKRRIDKNKVRSKNRKTVNVTVSPAWDIRMTTDNPVRAGAIMYTKRKSKTYFCVGVDAQYGDLTDFGGGVKKDESVVEGALRELSEESLGVFGPFEPESVRNVTTVYSNNMAIMFIPIFADMGKALQEFSTKIKNKKDPEVRDIIWLSKRKFMESVHGRGKKMYSRVRKILSQATDAIQDL